METSDKIYLVNRETYSKEKPNKPFGIVDTKNLADLHLVKTKCQDIKLYDILANYEGGNIARVVKITPHFINIKIFATREYIGSKFTDDGSKYEEEKKFYKWSHLPQFCTKIKKIKKKINSYFTKIDDDFQTILNNNWYDVSRFVNKNCSICYK